MQPWVLILVAMLLAAVLVPLARVRVARRRQLASLAMRKGWTYTAGDPWDLPAEMEGFWLGTWGHDRCCRDVISVPTQIGSLWLAQFERQMSSGRHWHTQRFALALVRANAACGGIAILPAGEMFAPTEPFQRYRHIEIPGPSPGRQIWAERGTSERLVIAALAKVCTEMPESSAVEARGNTAVIYWPMALAMDEKTLLALEPGGRQLIDIVGGQVGQS